MTVPGADLFGDLRRLPATGRAPRFIPPVAPAAASSSATFHFPAPRFVGSLPTAASASPVPPSASVGTALVGPLAAATAAASHFPAPRFIGAQVPSQLPTDSDPDPLTTLSADLAALAASLNAPARALRALVLARKTVILSGHPTLDVPFYAVYLTSPRFESFMHTLQLEAQGKKIPQHGPLEQASKYARLRFGFATQTELDDLFRLGAFNVDRQKALTRFTELQTAVVRARNDALVHLHPDAVFGSRLEAAEQRLRSLELGLKRRFDQEAIRRNRELQQFLIAMELAKVFTGKGDAVALPGEQGDP